MGTISRTKEYFRGTAAENNQRLTELHKEGWKVKSRREASAEQPKTVVLHREYLSASDVGRTALYGLTATVFFPLSVGAAVSTTVTHTICRIDPQGGVREARSILLSNLEYLWYMKPGQATGKEERTVYLIDVNPLQTSSPTE